MSLFAILGTVGVVVVFIAGGLWLDKRVSVIPRPGELAAGPEEARKKALMHGAGAAPETAIFADAHEIDRLVRKMRHCRARMAREADDEVVYDDRVLTVLRFKCGACGTRDRVYIQRSA